MRAIHLYCDLVAGRGARRAAGRAGRLGRRYRRAGRAAGRDRARMSRPRRPPRPAPRRDGRSRQRAAARARIAARRRRIGREDRAMAEVTAALVKELREKTGAGMMDCKRALERDRRRHRGRGRLAAQEGPVRGRQEGRAGRRRGAGRRRRRAARAGAVVEVNSETDFVARNEAFQGFVRTVAELALGERRRSRGAEGGALSRQPAAPSATS